MNANLPAAIAAVHSRTEQLKAALPASIPTAKFQRVVVSTLQRDPQLLQCTPGSIIQACEKAASDGLILDGKEAALVVFNQKDKEGKWSKAAQYLPMFQGLMKLAYNTGLIKTWNVGIVYQAEFDGGRFEYEAGDDAFIRHAPIIIGERGAPVAIYSIVEFKDGGKSRAIMRWDEVLKIARSQKKNVDDQGNLKGIWRDHTEEMGKKTIIRRHIKMLPFESDTRRAFEREDDLYTDERGDSRSGEIEVPLDEPAKPKGGAAARLNGRLAPQPQAEEVLNVDPETGEITPPAEEEDRRQPGDII